MELDAVEFKTGLPKDLVKGEEGRIRRERVGTAAGTFLTIIMNCYI